MRFWRRRARDEQVLTGEVTASSSSSAPSSASGASAASPPVPRIEKAVVALATHARQLEDRLDHLEERFTERFDLTMDYATVDDVLDARLHTARLASEIARISIELRAELERLNSVVDEHVLSPERRRVVALAETIVDLSDRLYDEAPPAYGSPFAESA